MKAPLWRGFFGKLQIRYFKAFLLHTLIGSSGSLTNDIGFIESN
jgi:hypothetical protein